MRAGVALLFVVACGSNTPHVATPAMITVLDPGAEPRQVLRYEPTLHVPERAEMTLKTRVTNRFTNTVLETGQRSIDNPSIRLVQRFDAVETTPTGETVMRFEIEDATVLDDVVDPALRALAAARSAKMKGLRGSWHLAPSGKATELVLQTPDAEHRSDLSPMRESSVVFPDVPVGIGATWQVTSHESIGGVTWDRKATYRLRGLADSTASIDADIAMHASSQALSTEPNATTTLTSATMNIAAQLTIPLHKLVTTSSAQGTSESNFSIVRGHLRITSTMQIEMLSSVNPIP